MSLCFSVIPADAGGISAKRAIRVRKSGGVFEPRRTCDNTIEIAECFAPSESGTGVALTHEAGRESFGCVRVAHALKMTEKTAIRDGAYRQAI